MRVPPPAELTVQLTPRNRYDVLDVTRQVAAEHGDVLRAYPRALYCSYHTTAGYLEQSLAARLGYSRQYLDPFIRLFQKLFPPEANYRHDQLDLRSELSAAERAVEPKNADSHLAFIGSGLQNCVTYVHRGPAPVYFIDLDGVTPKGSRRRRTTVLAYQREEPVAELELALPVSPHPVDSVNLRDPRLGCFERLTAWAAGHGVEHGRLDLSLDPAERNVGLTVNEFETLLMQHDLAEVLRDPVRFMAAKGKNMLRDPWAIPNKTLSYAKYDLVQVFNEAMDHLGIGESALERWLSRFLALPAARFLRLKRSVSFLVSGQSPQGPVVYGTYQSPILVQWRQAEGQRRTLRATLVRFS
jgi:thiamine phosphate synthase YjbQ (UPF0047 family)